MIDLSAYKLIDSYAIPMPRSFWETLEGTLRRVDEYAEELQLTHVFLFGSAARGSAASGSDIDLLLLTSAATEREVRRKVLWYELDVDTSIVPVQITVRKECRFVDPTCDDSGFHATILPDLRLLRRYPPAINQ